MPLVPHLARRGAVYYWRRKLPAALARFQNRQHAVLSLGTSDPVRARSLAVQLTAFFDEFITMSEPATSLTPRQLNAMLKEVIAIHMAKLDRVAAAAKSMPLFDVADAKRADARAAWTYHLLDAQGSGAAVWPNDRKAMRKAGLADVDVAAVGRHLDMLQNNGLVPTRPEILRRLIEHQNAVPSAMTFAQAQSIYFRGLAIALEQSDRRYGGKVSEADDLVKAVLAAQAHASLPERPADRRPPDEIAGPRSTPESHIQTNDQSPLGPQVQRNDNESMAPKCEVASPALDDSVMAIGDRLADDREKNSWDAETAETAKRLFAFFAKFLKEEHGIEHLNDLRQVHLANFVRFLSHEIYRNYGQSGTYMSRSIKELREIGRSKLKDQRGIGSVTLNKHLTYLGQLIRSAKGYGVEMSSGFEIEALRAPASKETRARDERPTMKLPQVERVFRAPPFVGCRSWEEYNKPGSEIYHRALYYVPILHHYLGGRREEFCGLLVDDVVTDNGPHPYIHIAKNEVRRIKNPQSQRNLPLHSEHIRLGFLNYVATIKALGYKLLFPDLFSPSTKSPLGDRFYDEFKPVLISCGITEKGVASHSMRKGFGNNLKQRGASEEERGDLLGHLGRSETSERYCEQYEINILYELILKIPVVTEHLSAHPINLLPWVQRKEIAPFSRATRKRP